MTSFFRQKNKKNRKSHIIGVSFFTIKCALNLYKKPPDNQYCLKIILQHRDLQKKKETMVMTMVTIIMTNNDLILEINEKKEERKIISVIWKKNNSIMI